MLLRGSGLPKPFEAVRHSIGKSNGSGAVACEPGSIACSNGISLSKSQIIYPCCATSSIAVHHAFGADRLRGEVGPKRAKEVREGVHQHVEYDHCAEELRASGKIAKADADQHFEGDQNGDEDSGYQGVDQDKELRWQLEVVETHVRAVTRN